MMKCLRDKKMLVGRVVALVAALLLTCAVFPRVARADEGSVRIHVLNFYEDEDAILVISRNPPAAMVFMYSSSESRS